MAYIWRSKRDQTRAELVKVVTPPLTQKKVSAEAKRRERHAAVWLHSPHYQRLPPTAPPPQLDAGVLASNLIESTRPAGSAGIIAPWYQKSDFLSGLPVFVQCRSQNLIGGCLIDWHKYHNPFFMMYYFIFLILCLDTVMEKAVNKMWSKTILAGQLPLTTNMSALFDED